MENELHGLNEHAPAGSMTLDPTVDIWQRFAESMTDFGGWPYYNRLPVPRESGKPLSTTTGVLVQSQEEVCE